MSWKIGMPNLGHTMEEGTVSEWLKAVGDVVKSGEVIAVVESDKASFDVEAPVDGVLSAIVAVAGSVVPVGETIGMIGVAGQTGITQQIQPDAVVAGAAPQVRGVASKGKISPAARALAEELGVDWQNIEGTGDSDIITRDDIRAQANQVPAKPVQANVAPVPASSGTSLSPMRQAIAQATQRAWQSIPHVPLSSHADVTQLLQSSGKALTAAVARACALALVGHPAFNGWLEGSTFKPSKAAHVTVAVSTADGLVTVVIEDAERKSREEISEELRALARKAKDGQLPGNKMTGGSFTISSLGRWGVDAFAPIISAPQVAILGVGRVSRVAREGPGGSVRFVSEMNVTLVFDHRANDGLGAAQFLAAIVGYLEHPHRMDK
jgi:pyruvate dehydrogenase E2 component (dihydrolipoamide acetyltransferase)